MNKLFIILTFVFSTIMGSAQNKMTVNVPHLGYSLNEHSKMINSMNDLPSIVSKNVNGYLAQLLGQLVDNTEFQSGRSIDLQSFFKSDSITYPRYWIVPKYDLRFKLVDETVGIQSYIVQLKLDEHGQLLEANWPRRVNQQGLKLSSVESIRQSAIRYATSNKFNVNDYEVDFKYNKELNKLCWIFQFKQLDTKTNDYDTIEVDWENNEIVKVYVLSKSGSY